MWALLTDIFLMLLAAYVLGILARTLKQSAIIGYLLAGAVAGPLLFNHETVSHMAELGVALLLFSIGLEFSFSRLKAMGRSVLAAGALQVSVTLVVFAGLLRLFLPFSAAVVVGSAFALSSTAIVLRVLLDQARVDAPHGRASLGILLVQDLAVVPLVLLVEVLGSSDGASSALAAGGKTVLSAGGLMALFYVLFYHVVPWVLRRQGLFANRELTILLAILSGLGAIGGAHKVGLSPALGAFVAGMLLAESPFAVQIRSDVDAIRTLFVTLFFTSVGMLLNPLWLLSHVYIVLPATVGVLALKAGIVGVILKVLRQSPATAAAAGVCLAQVGEFAFVLATSARAAGLLGDDLFAGVVSVSLLSMFAAPYMVTHAVPIADRILALMKVSVETATGDVEAGGECRALVVGFGPAGRRVADALFEVGLMPEILELNPDALNTGRDRGYAVHLGDASRGEVLEHAGLKSAAVVVVTLPDSRDACNVVRAVRTASPKVTVIARGRYNRHVPDLVRAGADLVVDEEKEVGEHLAEAAVRLVRESDGYVMACRMTGGEAKPTAPPRPQAAE